MIHLTTLRNRIDKLLKCLPGTNRAGGVLTISEYEKLKAAGELTGHYLLVPGIRDAETWGKEFKDWREGLTYES